MFVQSLFKDDDWVFFGGKERAVPGENFLRAPELIDKLEQKKIAPPNFVGMNPFTGKEEPTQNGGGKTYRGKACVARFARFLIEFESPDKDPESGLTLRQQCAFWAAVKLPHPLQLVSLTWSGGGSLHGLVSIPGIPDASEWERRIRGEVFPQIIKPLGADPAVGDACRLTRFPGGKRDGKIQRLLFLNTPESVK